MANDLTMFEETMADLYDFLDSHGFGTLKDIITWK